MGVCLLGRRVAGALVGRAVIVARDDFVIVISLVVPSFVIIAGFVVIGIVAVLAVVVAARAAVATVVVAAAAIMIAAVLATVVVAIMIVATVVVVAALAAAVMVAAAVATALATLAAFGKGLGHAELDRMVDMQRQGCRQADSQGGHGGGLQQAAQAGLAKLALVPRRCGILLARNRIHLSYPPDRTG
ncbi:MAG TPA: hypothetical protein VGF43_09905, partial [Dongiaceae bacterium]